MSESLMNTTGVAILGSTGSIGCNSLRVIESLTTRRMRVVALAAGTNVERLADQGVGGLLLEFDLGRRGVVRADEAVPVAPALDHRLGLGLEHGVDAAQLVADFPGEFQEQRLGAGKHAFGRRRGGRRGSGGGAAS